MFARLTLSATITTHRMPDLYQIECLIACQTPECMPDRMPEHLPNKISEYMPVLRQYSRRLPTQYKAMVRIQDMSGSLEVK